MKRAARLGERLLAALRGSSRLTVLTHENPDPDGIASGAALVQIATARLGLDARLAYTGIIGRAENKAMVELLEIEMVEIDPECLTAEDTIAVVDAQPEAGNLPLPQEVYPAIVVDHHPYTPALSRVVFSDVRPWYGATSTIFAEYLIDLGVTIPVPLATALYYGVKTDTLNLSRHTTEADREAYTHLWRLVDKDLLPKIEFPRLSRQYFETFHSALERAEVHGDVVVSSLEVMDNPNAVAEVADLLLRLEGMTWSLCTGIFGDHLFVSLRTSSPDLNAGEIVKKALRGLGTSGGHGVMAGGKVHLSGTTPVARRKALEEVESRFLAVLGVQDKTKERLLGARAKGTAQARAA